MDTDYYDFYKLQRVYGDKMDTITFKVYILKTQVEIEYWERDNTQMRTRYKNFYRTSIHDARGMWKSYIRDGYRLVR